MKFKNIKKSSSSRKSENTTKKENVKKSLTKVAKKVAQEKVIEQKEKWKDIQTEKTNKKHLFTSIYRFITEKKIWLAALLLLAGISLFIVRLDVYMHRQALTAVEAQRQELVQKEQYWIRVTKEKPTYRDGYLEVALYAYQLKDKKIALENVQKALDLDPNFEKGLQLRGIIEKMN